MDRPTTRKDADARGSRPLPHEAFVLPSRRSALDLCRGLVGDILPATSSVGPLLLTGDAGVGKTWLCRRLEAEAPTNARWVGVDLTPANTPIDLYRLLAHELGLADSCALTSGRVELIDFLAERQADGQRLTLVIDEAQNLAMPVWEEVRILANRLDRPGGFSRMVLVGQTSLARRFSTRPFAAIEARLALKIHLGPIDADEAVELVARFHPARDWSAEEIEAIHRDSGGNPRRILRKLGPVSTTRNHSAELLEIPVPEPVAPIEAARTRVEPSPIPARPALVQGPLMGPARPPIRVDENMIEVGWSPDDSVVSDDPGERVAHPSGGSAAIEGGEEAVLDHYAALQAWQEWTENQARRAQPSAISVEPANGSEPLSDDEIDDVDNIEEEADEMPLSRPDRTRVRIEKEQKFAPFGQLFSRMAQAHDSE
jgi:type II secretory pathway predicted ATPase ExeA